MAEVATIARPYAEAAFRLADSAGSVAAWSQALGQLAQVVNAPEVQSLVGSPNVTASRLTDLLASLSGSTDAQVRQFLSIIVENKRVPALSSVHEHFEVLKNEREGTIDAFIQSAFPIDDAQLTALVGDLERRYKRKIRAQVGIDKELIGGVLVRVGDEVIDGSVRGKLATMSVALTH